METEVGTYYFIVKNMCEYHLILHKKSIIVYTHVSILKYFDINKAHKSKYIDSYNIVYGFKSFLINHNIIIYCYPV